MSDRTALVLGASGLVGGHVLRRLASDDRWSRVVSLGRRPLPTGGPGHEDHVVDFARLGEQAELFACDDVVCCLGTTIKQAGSKEAFRRVDLEIPFEAAQLAHTAGATQLALVSALGADPDARIFYNQVKGEAEAAVENVGFEGVHLFRPSLLAGDRDSLPRSSGEVRVGERIGQVVLGALTPVLRGPLAPLRPTEADDVAAAIVAVLAASPHGRHVYEPDAIREWAAR